MKVLLVAPGGQRLIREGPPRQKALFPPLALPLLAALAPEEVEVRLVDEAVERVDLAEDADLVGISAMTAQAPRAYQIADAFRARGAKVVLGGMHPSARPEEAAEHADAVVIGEAETVWPRVIEDAKSGRLKRLYKCEERPDLTDLPIPRRSLLKEDAYVSTGVVQATRGCPHACSFCSVSSFFGRTYRFRPVEKVVAEVADLRDRLVFFVDDNIMAAPAYAKRLFEGLTGLGKQWFGQSSLTMLKDGSLLRLAARSGCKGLFVGLESLSQTNLATWGKTFNVAASYREAVRRLHDFGIGVIGSFMFGADEDDADVFERTVEFVERAHLDAAQFSILTPLPGTRLYQQMEQEGRLLERDWAKYDGGHVVFRPLRMRVEEIERGFRWVLGRVYSVPGIVRRTWDGWLRRPIFGPLNLAFRQRIRGYLRRNERLCAEASG
jgi:radical SAM superfamily enzyme YgiQ (UPF0313 family)